MGVGAGWVGTAGGQEPATVACSGQRVSAIRVDTRAPSVTGVRGIPVVAGIARTVHVTTKPSVVTRLLVLRVGQPCTELRRMESERILRAQPFIAAATVEAVPDGMGGVVLEVSTIDEVAAVFGAVVQARGPSISGLKLGDANWGGQGISAVGGWRHADALRDGFAFRATDYEFLGRPYQATVIARRDPLGGQLHADIQRPFLTDLQRVAWRAQEGTADDYVRFVDPAGAVHANRLTRNYADVGGVGRIGPPGRLALVGLSLSHESERPGAVPVVLTDSGVRDDPASPLSGRYTARAASRVNALLGYRNLKFIRTTGLGGLRAVRDVPSGIEVGTLIGKSASFLGSSTRDVLVGGDVYAGHATATSAAWLQLTGEGRRDLGTQTWETVLGSGRAGLHQRVGAGQTLVSAVEWSGGWNVGVPFRVTLAGNDGGVRGMPENEEQGGRRVIARLEDRWAMESPVGTLASLGLAAFANAGWLWAGDAPYGTTTTGRYSVGISLLAAVPARSPRVWRLDIALPSTPDHRVRLSVRLSTSDWTSTFWREPRDISVARERSVPVSLFGWP